MNNKGAGRVPWFAAAAIAGVVACSQAVGTEARPPGGSSAEVTVIRVGPTRALARPSAAAKIARDGDVVEIDAGVYEGDAAVWRQNGLTIRGAGGRAHLKAGGAHAEGKAIWVIKGSGTVVENIEFSGASVPDGNGAGIRQEGANLTLRRCYFHHNQTGLLTGTSKDSDILIEHSEFAHNGTGGGQTHNIYVGVVRSFTLRYSYVHHAVVGHDVKSRAARNDIRYNRIADENDGRSSYSVDLSNGGLSFLIGNVIQQGPATENSGIVSYGAEGYVSPVNELYVINNTIVNDRPNGGRFIGVRAGAPGVHVLNNVFSGPGELLSGPGELPGNIRVPRSDFANPAGFDYRLKAGSAALGRAANPGLARGVDLRPNAEYVHTAGHRPRRAREKFDMGAFEFQP